MFNTPPPSLELHNRDLKGYADVFFLLIFFISLKTVKLKIKNCNDGTFAGGLYKTNVLVHLENKGFVGHAGHLCSTTVLYHITVYLTFIKLASVHKHERSSIHIEFSLSQQC